MSVCEIETSETYEKGRPKRGGLSDPRMGTMDRAMKCETDGMSSTDTPGYFGHLELAKPVYHHGFIKNVVSVLRCVGFSSSKLMIDKVREWPSERQRLFSRRPPRKPVLSPYGISDTRPAVAIARSHASATFRAPPRRRQTPSSPSRAMCHLPRDRIGVRARRPARGSPHRPDSFFSFRLSAPAE